MQINPYLNLHGMCKEAFRFYEKLLGGKVESISSFGDSPDAETHPTITPWMVNCEIGD